jgi:hypothetical protein
MVRLSSTLFLLILMINGAAFAQAATFPRTVPAPEKVFGFKPGADYRLADYSQMIEYYRLLDEASDRIRVVDVGATAEGRRMIMAVISSEQNLADLERYRSISEKMARAEIGEEEALELAGIGKAVVWIDSGLHASEVGHAQHSPELAYRVVTDESPGMRLIRENVIFLQLPVMNPDGLDMVAKWYRQNLGTRYETSALPQLYHKYAGHDNNRDWFMMTQPETRNVSLLLYHQWFPQIVLNHHQTPPFPARIFIPPFTSPVNPNIPALVLRGIDMIGNAMASRFEEEGKSGVVSRMEFDAWWNGGMRTTPCFHNMIGILAETALYYYATPFYYKKESLPKRFKNGLPSLDPSPDYPTPWLGGSWRLSDSVEYMLTASLGVLDVAARHRDKFLMNIYRMGRNAIEQETGDGIYAYLIPPEQHDPSSALQMVEVLKLGGLDIEQAQEGFYLDGERFAEGTFIIRTAQAFRPYLTDLMEVHKYPERQNPGQVLQPYDMTGWTLPMQMGVKVVRATEPLRVRTRVVVEPALPQPAPLGPHRYFAIDRSWNTSYILVNRLMTLGIPVRVHTGELPLPGLVLPAGSFLVDGEQAFVLQKLAADLRIPVHGVDRAFPEPVVQLVRPRVALYRSFNANQDEGWMRWLFERYEFSFQTVEPEAIKRGNLRESWDAIILPSESLKRLVDGHPDGTMPPLYSSGVGAQGIGALREFVEQGGVLIVSGGSTDELIRAFGLPVKNPLQRASGTEFSCPGSLLRVEVDRNDPIGWGMDEEVAACFVRSQAFELPRKSVSSNTGYRLLASDRSEVEPTSVVRYAESNILMSGWIRGEKLLEGKGAVVRVPFGDGDIVLLGFPVHFRGQSHATFKLLFNSVFLAGTHEDTTYDFYALTSPAEEATN